MADQREGIINFIRYNGPVLPVQIAKHVNTNILFASAMLSELVSARHLKMSRAAIGGSPLYYLPGQEALMDERLSTSLKGREKEAYKLLKDNKVLREVDLEPWQRIAVKSLTDFSVPLSVKYNGGVENFWKHHLVSDEESKGIVSNILEDNYSTQQQVQEIISRVQEQSVVQTTLEEVRVETPKIVETVKEPEIIEETAEAKEEIKIQTIEEKKISEPKPAEKPKRVQRSDPQFYSKVLSFIKSNKIEVLKEEIVKKNREFDFVVNIPTVFGRLKYLVKAKSKSSINEADVSIAFSEGQLKKIPVILLVDGKATKKASLMVEQKMQGQIVIKHL